MKKKMSAKKKRTIIISSVLIAAVLAGMLYTFLKPDPSLKVETVTASKDTIYQTLDTTGSVSAESEKKFVLVDGAKVASVNVKVGDIVEAGDVIATFDTASLEIALAEKEANYKKTQSAYATALKDSEAAKGKVASVKKQIAELESQVEKLKAESNKPQETKPQSNADAKPSNDVQKVKVSDSLVKRFVRIAKLFGVEYTEEQAEKLLVNMLSAGSSISDLTGMLDNLGSIANNAGSFDMSAFASIGGSSSALMSAETNLVQLKAQLAMLELQSDGTYLAAYKTVAERAKTAYDDIRKQIDEMKIGWKADKKGIISEVNIKVGQTFSADSSQADSADITSIISALTSGGDINSLLGSFMGSSEKTAVKILYYPLIADISLSKYDILNVDLNQSVTVKSANGTEFEGKVSYVSAVATSSDGSLNLGSLVGSGSSSTIPAQVTIQDADNSVIVGVDVDISIVTNTAENAVIVPVEAVCIEGGEVFVYKYDKSGSKAVKQKIELGISNDTYYQVLSGINEGDVLIKNKSGLEDGVKVDAE